MFCFYFLNLFLNFQLDKVFYVLCIKMHNVNRLIDLRNLRLQANGAYRKILVFFLAFPSSRISNFNIATIRTLLYHSFHCPNLSINLIFYLFFLMFWLSLWIRKSRHFNFCQFFFYSHKSCKLC